MNDTPRATALADMYEEELLQADGYDAAILGVSMGDPPRLIYSVSKILEILMAGDDGPDEEGDDPSSRAREYADYNILGAYVGERTPIYCEDECLYHEKA